MAFASVTVLMSALRERAAVRFRLENGAGLREQAGESATIYDTACIAKSGSGPQDRVGEPADAKMVEGALGKRDPRVEATARPAVQIDAAGAARQHSGKAGTGLGFESVAAARAFGVAARIELRRDGCAVARIECAPRLTGWGCSHSVS